MPLRIQGADLLDAVGDNYQGTVHYLDLESGEVVAVNPDLWMSTDPEHQEMESMADDPRFRAIDPVDSGEAWRWMDAFVYQLPDGRARAELERAIQGSRPFRRFKDALSQYPELRQEWFRSQEERLLEYARAWLEGEEIEAEIELAPSNPTLRSVQ
jgi:hypothetical protein